MSEQPSEATPQRGCALCGVTTASAVMLPCYRLRSCPFGDELPPAAECPARNIEHGCWAFDWVSYFEKLPPGAAREEWRLAMLDACPECEVFALHEDELGRVLERLRRA
ncbi:MAG: hypothetical protein GF330_06015 [Candidatus Eisenbacteria bacterium]|nr:hypothetical protein [Candidatus Eisenbacteria bacterium]